MHNIYFSLLFSNLMPTQASVLCMFVVFVAVAAVTVVVVIFVTVCTLTCFRNEKKKWKTTITSYFHDMFWCWLNFFFVDFSSHFTNIFKGLLSWLFCFAYLLIFFFNFLSVLFHFQKNFFFFLVRALIYVCF